MVQRDDVVMWLPVLAESVSVARHRVRRFVRLPLRSEAILGLLVSEMVGTAVRALPPTPDRRIEVRLRCDRDVVRAEVNVDGLWRGAVRDGDGMSLMILTRLADATGTTDEGMWVELHAHAARAA